MKKRSFWSMGVPAALTLFLMKAPLQAFMTDQNASYVLGEPTMSTNNQGISQSGMSQPLDVSYDPDDQWLFVPDHQANRVLIYDLSGGISTGMNASWVLGQSDFNSTAQPNPPNASSMSNPSSTAYDAVHHQLFVADAGNLRVLVFDLSHTPTNGMAAVHVLGQPGFTTAQVFPPNQYDFQVGSGNSLAYDPMHQYLFVSDYTNNRVLVFNLSFGISDYMQATGVLGQASFSSNGTSSASNGMSQPVGMAYDATFQRLFVADNGNNRVLSFDLTSGIQPPPFQMAAANIPVQWDGGCDASGGNDISDLAFDPIGQRLFVRDNDYGDRILEFDLLHGISNNMRASVALGQPNLTTCIPADSTYVPSPFWVNHGCGITFDVAGQRLFVSDYNTGRVLVFTGLPWTCGNSVTSCNSTSISGTIIAAENSSDLPGVPVQLRNSSGTIISTKISDNNGAYDFGTGDGLVVGQTYSVGPVVGRTQTSYALMTSVMNLPPGGALLDAIAVRGSPTSVLVNGLPAGSLVIISTMNYSGTLPPPVASGSMNTYIASATAGADGTASLTLTPGLHYYMTCWLAQLSGLSISYSRFPVGNSKPVTSSSPNQSVALSCS